MQPFRVHHHYINYINYINYLDLDAMRCKAINAQSETYILFSGHPEDGAVSSISNATVHPLGIAAPPVAYAAVRDNNLPAASMENTPVAGLVLMW